MKRPLFLFIISAAAFGVIAHQAFGMDWFVMPKKDALTFRDPFESRLPKKETPAPVATVPATPTVAPSTETATPAPEETQTPPVSPQPSFPTLFPTRPVEPPALTLSGLVWNSSRPQAIVNDQVVSVGDSVSGAKITAIDKNEIKILFKDQPFTIKYNSQPESSTEPSPRTP